ncbi:MAG: hypothetical protein JSS98_07810 [Bacteroidetes bacterium]|nr:hypothetical protein [Bacteroidota bacterium]
MEKITSYKKHKSGKFIELTKKFLTDPKFLQFAYYQISGVIGTVDILFNRNDLRFEYIALQIKNATYKFKPAQHLAKLKQHSEGTSILLAKNSTDRVVQQAMVILLEMIYENNGYFQEESHGYRPNKSYHSALLQIKKE